MYDQAGCCPDAYYPCDAQPYIHPAGVVITSPPGVVIVGPPARSFVGPATVSLPTASPTRSVIPLSPTVSLGPWDYPVDISGPLPAWDVEVGRIEDLSA